MNVKGEKQFNVSRSDLWTMLMDPEVLAKITPGVSELETISSDTYKTVSKIKIGPVGGVFKGDLKVVDKDEPASFALEMKQLSKIGNADVRVNMNIADADGGGSLLSFDGKAKLSGTIARTGQRVLSGVANAITNEVFASLEKHIAENTKAESQPVVSESVANNATGNTQDSSGGGILSGLIKWIKNLFG